jgi:hypothetical protein
MQYRRRAANKRNRELGNATAPPGIAAKRAKAKRAPAKRKSAAKRKR